MGRAERRKSEGGADSEGRGRAWSAGAGCYPCLGPRGGG